jgi:hypothetical protein
VKTITLASVLLTVFVAAPAAKAQNNDHSKGICPWPGTLDGVKTETHKVIFENEHVRVLEVTIRGSDMEKEELTFSHLVPGD